MTIKSFCVGTIRLGQDGIEYDAAYPKSSDILDQLTHMSAPMEERYRVKEECLFETEESLKDYRIKNISAL